MQDEFQSITDYKLALKEELAARCKQNPRYSLRAFARDLKLSPSRLSEILNGKQGLSRPAAEKIAVALGYGPSEKERFCDLVESLHARSKRDRETAKIRLKKHQIPSKVHQLHLDAFKAIADWYHFALLELIHVSGFRSDAKWIGKRLGISEFEVQLALDRLLRLGLLTWKGDKLKLTHDHGAVPDDVPAESIKRFHTQILGKAQEAVQLQSVENREFRAEIIALAKSQLPEAKKMLREFAHRFCKKVDEAEPKDSLYCLALQLFELGEKG